MGFRGRPIDTAKPRSLSSLRTVMMTRVRRFAETYPPSVVLRSMREAQELLETAIEQHLERYGEGDEEPGGD